MKMFSIPHLAAAALKCAGVLFWCWNVIFICATLPLLPAVPALLQAWWLDDAPADYVFMLLAWLVVPWVCVVLARTRLLGRPQAVAFLFFAVEGPFFSLCLYRLVAMREVTPAVGQWLAMAAFGLCVHGADALLRPLPRTALWHALKLVASVCLVLVAAYAGALALLAWLPLALRGAWEVVSPGNWVNVLTMVKVSPALLFFIPVSTLLVLLTAASLLAMPLCMVLIGWRTAVHAWGGGPLGVGQRAAAVAAMLALQAGVFALVNQQPQKEAFARLESGALTPAQFDSAQKDLRAGLLNAYLASYRYASSEPESKGIAKMYENLLGLPPGLAALPQAAFNALATPLLYDGDDMASDARRAAELYEQYFDTPIQRGERTAIARALSATHDQDERESGLINIDQRKVWVAEQRVRVQALQGDLARITLDETYVNLTPEPQEIFYLFSLPESVAITGLWLGTSPDQMLPHTVATRGAAQRVYKAEVNRRVDPALLEQVGPRQYRLRAFPVPPRPQPRAGRPVLDANQKLYLRLQYTALASQGTWPLPVLAEKRNVAFDRHTQRSCDGGPCPADGASWWPRDLPGPGPGAPAAHAFRLQPEGPAVTALPTPDAAPPLRGKKVTLVIDRSRSMAAQHQALLATVRAARTQLAGNTVSVLLTTTSVMPQAPLLVPLGQLTDEQLGVFMGGGRVDELLRQAAEHAPPAQDLILVVTDNGAFDLDADKTRHAIRGGMLSFVHLGGSLAPAYDDATLQAVQASVGSSFTGLEEAWAHFARMQNAAPGFLMQRDGYTFSVAQDAGAQPGGDDASFAAIAARLFVAEAVRRDKAPSPQQLDALHAVARQHSVVTPYSSMMVLVNTEQQEALAKAQAGEDRFERAQEQGIETLQKPNNPLSASVTPEPEEWLLLLVSLCAAVWMVRARRRSAAVGGAPAGAAY